MKIMKRWLNTLSMWCPHLYCLLFKKRNMDDVNMENKGNALLQLASYIILWKSSTGYFRFLDFCDNTKIDDLTLFKQLPVSDMIPVIHRYDSSRCLSVCLTTIFVFFLYRVLTTWRWDDSEASTGPPKRTDRGGILRRGVWGAGLNRQSPATVTGTRAKISCNCPCPQRTKW